MIASQLVAAVTAKVLQPDFDTTAILAILNRGQLEIAGGGDRPHGEALVAPLPDLFTSGTVAFLADTPTAAMPANFQRGLTRVTYLGEALKKYDSHIEFLERFEGETGTPEGYCLKGKTLWIGPTPTAGLNVTAYYHRLPTDMQIVAGSAGPPVVPAVDSPPDGIPAHLQYKLLFNYACREIFSMIEQGVEGHSPDTTKHAMLYHTALTDLERFIGPEDGPAQNVADEYYPNI